MRILSKHMSNPGAGLLFRFEINSFWRIRIQKSKFLLLQILKFFLWFGPEIYIHSIMLQIGVTPSCLFPSKCVCMHGLLLERLLKYDLDLPLVWFDSDGEWCATNVTLPLSTKQPRAPKRLSPQPSFPLRSTRLVGVARNILAWIHIYLFVASWN